MTVIHYPDFTAAFLPTMPFSSLRDVLGKEYDHGLLYSAYCQWFDRYSRKAVVVYRSQLRRHYEVMLERYSLATGITWDDMEAGSHDQEAYEEARLLSGYDEHETTKSALRKQEREYFNDLYLGNPPVLASRPMSETLDSWYAERTSPEYKLTIPIWMVWFETVTGVGLNEQERLRRLEYKDYLASDYWKQVRIAMLIVHQTRCQAFGCSGLDGWYGAESKLHVHHLHYDNKGREQYDNLVLLCESHHRSAHEDGHLESEDTWALSG